MTSDDEAPSERWRRVERVYLSALGRKDVERSAVLDDLCRGDDMLRRDVESLLRVQPEARSFLDTGAMAVAAEIMRGEVGTDLTGQTLDGYTITGRLGAGGMGEVYRAHDSRLGRDVAIKTLPLELANNPDRLSRFDREARALAALNHPNIATIHGIAQRQAELRCRPPPSWIFSSWSRDRRFRGGARTRPRGGVRRAPDRQTCSAPQRQPLDRAARAVMESRFGVDISRVRVHSDATAAASAKRLGARAYAVADRLLFDHRRYRPESARVDRTARP